MIAAFGDSKDVRRNLITALVSVDGDGALGVDGETFVRVDHHSEQTRVGLEQDIYTVTISRTKDHVINYAVTSWPKT